MNRKALGKGLSALIPEKVLPASAVTTIPIENIAPNPRQPRKYFSPETLSDLSESIRSQGVLQPILVKSTPSGYELIAGERRWRAAQQAGLTEIPALIKDVDRQESLALALVENIQRENLNPVEAAHAYQALAEEFGLTQEQISQLVGKDRASVANYLRLLKLPLAIQEDLIADRISMGHARALLALSDRGRLLALGRQIVSKGLSVREAERLARKTASHKTLKKGSAVGDPHLGALCEEIKRKLGAKVDISLKGRRGNIKIFFSSLEELDRLIEFFIRKTN